MARTQNLPEGAEKIAAKPAKSDAQLVREAEELRRRRDVAATKSRQAGEEDVGKMDGDSIIEAAVRLDTSDATVVLGDAEVPTKVPDEIGGEPVPDELRGLVGSGADAVTIERKGGSLIEPHIRSAKDGNFNPEGPEQIGEPVKDEKKDKGPAVGDHVWFHTQVRRAGRRDHQPVPAIVTAVDEEGKASLTVFEPGKLRFVKRIGSDKRLEERWSAR